MEKKKAGRPRSTTLKPEGSRRDYHMYYYHSRMKKEYECPHCKHKVHTHSGLSWHINNNNACLFIRILKINEGNIDIPSTAVATKYKKLLEDTEKERGE